MNSSFNLNNNQYSRSISHSSFHLVLSHDNSILGSNDVLSIESQLINENPTIYQFNKGNIISSHNYDNNKNNNISNEGITYMNNLNNNFNLIDITNNYEEVNLYTHDNFDNSINNNSSGSTYSYLLNSPTLSNDSSGSYIDVRNHYCYRNENEPKTINDSVVIQNKNEFTYQSNNDLNKNINNGENIINHQTLDIVSDLKVNKINSTSLNIKLIDNQTIKKTNQNYDKILTLDNPTEILVLDTVTGSNLVPSNKTTTTVTTSLTNLTSVETSLYNTNIENENFGLMKCHIQNNSIKNLKMNLNPEFELEVSNLKKRTPPEVLDGNTLKLDRNLNESQTQQPLLMPLELKSQPQLDIKQLIQCQGDYEFDKFSPQQLLNSPQKFSDGNSEPLLKSSLINTFKDDKNMGLKNIIGNNNNSNNKENHNSLSITEFHINLKKHKIFICKKCKRSFESSSNLTSHIRCHLDENEQICCQFCDKKFKRRNDLERHKFTHHYKLKLLCNGEINGEKWGCDMQYSRRDALVKHWNGRGKKCLNHFKELNNLPDSINIKELRRRALRNITQLHEDID